MKSIDPKKLPRLTSKFCHGRRPRGLPVAVLVLVLLSLTPLLKGQLSSANGISFQGALTAANGQPLPNGAYTVVFRFYDSPSTNKWLYATTNQGVAVTGGVISTAIQVDPGIFDGTPRYLGVAVDGSPELSPRATVLSVPTAMAVTTPNLKLRPGGPSKGYAGSLEFGNGAGDVFGFFTPTASQSALVAQIVRATGEWDFWSLPYSLTNDSRLVRLRPELPAIQVSRKQGGYGLLGANENGGTLYLAFNDAHASAYVRAGILSDTRGEVQVLDGNNNDVLIQGNANISLRRDNGATTTIQLNGLSGTVTSRIIEITGGADLAEHLTVTAPNPPDEFEVEPGMVVSIDPTSNRKFKLSDEPYDRKRVGVISGGNGVKPGLVLHDEGNPQADGDQPVALVGQVWCHADASFGAITPGDLLTTSSTPGHAMKVTDDAKARLAVLGQALTGLKEGRGWVQVLVGKE